MSSCDKTKPESEAATYESGVIPESELAHEIGRESNADLHADPDDPSPTLSVAEAAAMRAWRVAECLLTLRSQVNALAPSRSKVSDGTIGDAAHQSRASDHNPWVRDGVTGIVTAMDITHNPESGCDAELLAQALHKDKDPRIKYLIWNRLIANSSAVGGAQAWAWRPYRGANPHTRHIHISVKPEKARYDSEEPWDLPNSLEPVSRGAV